MAKSITLLIPGLLDNLPENLPRLPALETLLARADCRDDHPVGYERTLMHLFRQPQSPDRDVPEGALSRYAQTDEKPEGVWLCVAPVHLFADQSRVYLNTIDETALSEKEATQLIEELNKVYAEDGWEFIQHTRTRWYLRIADDPAIRTTSLREVDGKPIHDKLPQGEDALHWHRVLNEMQMLLHASPVNLARQERGDITVNGVWLWGVGGLPEVRTVSQWNAVYANEPLAQGLSLLNGSHAQTLMYNIEKYLGYVTDGAELIVHVPGIQSDVASTLKQLEYDWIEPMFNALKRHEITSISLQFADGREWCTTYTDIYRFWKVRKIFSFYAK